MESLRVVGKYRYISLPVPGSSSAPISIVEYATRDEAQRSIRELAEMPLLGRPVFIREVRRSARSEMLPHLLLQYRETESRFGATPVPGKIGMALAHGSGMGGHNAFGGPRALPPSSGAGNQLYVGNVRPFIRCVSMDGQSRGSNFPPKLPYQAGWQDLKDLFRSAGNIIRADINIGFDGRAKGSGTVIFESAKDAQAAISAYLRYSLASMEYINHVAGMYHGYEWYGRVLEVREVCLVQDDICIN
jgi:RNA recognition motif-containing protein